jgi:hypothetical protein
VWARHCIKTYGINKYPPTLGVSACAFYVGIGIGQESIVTSIALGLLHALQWGTRDLNLVPNCHKCTPKSGPKYGPKSCPNAGPKSGLKSGF